VARGGEPFIAPKYLEGKTLKVRVGGFRNRAADSAEDCFIIDAR
jgi:hypothetical protein